MLFFHSSGQSRALVPAEQAWRRCGAVEQEVQGWQGAGLWCVGHGLLGRGPWDGASGRNQVLRGLERIRGAFPVIFPPALSLAVLTHACTMLSTLCHALRRACEHMTTRTRCARGHSDAQRQLVHTNVSDATGGLCRREVKNLKYLNDKDPMNNHVYQNIENFKHDGRHCIVLDLYQGSTVSPASLVWYGRCGPLLIGPFSRRSSTRSPPRARLASPSPSFAEASRSCSRPSSSSTTSTSYTAT